MTTNKPTPLCCEQHCKNRCTWHIATGSGPDDYTHACTAHVGAMLTKGATHVVSPFVEDTNG